MATFERDGISIYYEIHGEGFPLLLFAPGGMRSAIPFWESSAWNPIETLSPHFQVIAMDQRNAGQSTAPISATDGWATYTDDHIALLDHLDVERTHLLGGCIGGPYCLGVMERARERVAAAVLQQTIGDDGTNQPKFFEMFDAWAEGLKEDHPNMQEADWQQFRANMFGGDFVYNVSREFVAACDVPMLVLMGDDAYHPQHTSRQVADLALNATLVESWKDPEADGTVERVLAFLQEHTPT